MSKRRTRHRSHNASASPVHRPVAAAKPDGEPELRGTARRLASILLSDRAATLVGAVVAVAITIAFFDTLAFHRAVIRHDGAHTAGTEQPLLLGDPRFLHPQELALTELGLRGLTRGLLLITLAIVFVTRSAHVFFREERGSIDNRFIRPRRAWDQLGPAGFLVEMLLTWMSVGLAFLGFDTTTAVMTTALGATVVWRVVKPPKVHSEGAFLVELTSSLGALAGIILMGWRCGLDWLVPSPNTASAAPTLGEMYRRMELSAFWNKDAPLLAIILVVGSTYMGYLQHGLGSDQVASAASARRLFPRIAVAIVVVAVAVVAMDLLYPDLPEFATRSRNLAAATSHNAQFVEDAYRTMLVQHVHHRDVLVLLCGTVGLAILHGILCSAASGVAASDLHPEKR